ncbi:MAG: FemAB family PEP-CTERM system-associated protein [Planctomycetota bacterium]|nr:MAG: FemAB family PEP-CTERM system-associated protein [Planctomycetota bacterium]
MTATTTTTTITTTKTDAEPAPPVVHLVDDAPTRAAWREYVERHREATLFHHPDWSDAVAETFGHQPAHLFAERGGRLVGVLPLLEVRSWLAGRLLVSLPYAVYGGVLADDRQTTEALAAAAEDLAVARGARCVDLHSRRAAVESWPCDTRYAAFRKRLPASVADLATYLPRKARAAARQAQRREGLVVRHDDHAIPDAWRLYARSMRRLASIAYPMRFFEALARRPAWRTWVTFAQRDDRPVAAVASFVFRDTVLPYFLGVDERLRCTGATNLLYLGVMERAVRAGLSWFDFGRTRRDNHGPFAFKRNQGFEPRTLEYQSFAPPGARRPNLSPDNPRFAVARKLWPRLPLALTTRLGSWLSSSIPG